MPTGPSEETPIDLLARLVSIDSVNPVYGGRGESEIANFVEDWLERRSIPHRAQEIAPGRRNIVARVGPIDAPALLLEAHMDTVGVGGWASGSPFELTRNGSRYFGRGSCDTKASLACFMLVTSHFHREPDTLERALVFSATVDEENEQIGAYRLAELKSELGIVEAITGEPTRSDVVARHKGVGRFRIETLGKAAHGSTPDLGDNAIYKAARICERLRALSERLGEDQNERPIESGSLNLGAIQGGIGFNIVPDRCYLEIDRRVGTRENPSLPRQQLERICQSEAGARLQSLLERPALRGPHSAAFVRRILEAGTRIGHTIREREVAYMTNAVAYEEAGIPAVVFGPGDIAQAHKVDEYIEAGEMEKSLGILKALLSR